MHALREFHKALVLEPKSMKKAMQEARQEMSERGLHGQPTVTDEHHDLVRRKCNGHDRVPDAIPIEKILRFEFALASAIKELEKPSRAGMSCLGELRGHLCVSQCFGDV